MNRKKFLGNWIEAKGKVKQIFAILICNELLFKQGKMDVMLGQIQMRKYKE